MLLSIFPGEYAICRLAAGAALSMPEGLAFLAHTSEETSLVCAAQNAPPHADIQRGYTLMRVLSPHDASDEAVALDFSLVGIIASISAALAAAKVPIFVVSTYDTDYFLVPTESLARAEEALRDAGHRFAPEVFGKMTPGA